MEWKQVQVFTTTQGIDPLCGALMELDIAGFSIEDAADFRQFLQGTQGRWDYIDEDLMKLEDCESSVTFYLPDTPQGEGQMAAVGETLARMKAMDREGAWGRLEFAVSPVRDEDWETSWKAYYKPTKIGNRLVVCPTWEEYEPAPGETVVRLDPGMAFGTGTHDSTRLCLELLEEHAGDGGQVLDIGCGSGILAVTALLLGANRALGIDIDQVAVRVAAENAQINQVESRASFRTGSLAAGVTGQYDIAFANIVADIILKLAPDVPGLLAPNGVFITSGIIDDRAAEVEAALGQAGLEIAHRRESGGWVAFAARKARE